MKKMVLFMSMVLALALAVNIVPAFAVDETIIAKQGSFELARVNGFRGDDCLYYSVTDRVIGGKNGFVFWDFRDTSIFKRKKRPLIAKRLFEVEGVTEILLTSYGIEIHAISASRRETLKPKIEAVLLSYYGFK